MRRTKAQRKRGRPADPNARRRQTTRAGRAGRPVIDHGAPLLLARKVRDAAGRVDVDLADLIGVLHAHRRIDAGQLATLRQVELWVVQSRRARSLALGSVENLWNALLSGQHGGVWRAPVGGAADRASPGDRAWRALCTVRDEFTRRRELPSLAIVLRVVEGVALPAVEEMGLFASGIAGIAELVRRGRR